MWKCNGDKEHLFQKHLSKLSTGPLQELCREVGKSFHAIRPGAERLEHPHTQASPISQLCGDVQTLQEEKQQLKQFAKMCIIENQREIYKLKRHCARQKGIIAKYEHLMEGFLRDTGRLSEH